MSTPQITDTVEGRHAPEAAQHAPTVKPSSEQPLDKAAYAEKAASWNEQPLQAWRIAALIQTDRVYAVLSKKELQFDLLDWFEDARVGAVMRGEKIVSEGEFWNTLYRQSIGAIQQHFGSLNVRVVESVPQGKQTVLFGEKPNRHAAPSPMPSPVATKPPGKPKKRSFKQRA